jgi:hypothetical protein
VLLVYNSILTFYRSCREASFTAYDAAPPPSSKHTSYPSSPSTPSRYSFCHFIRDHTILFLDFRPVLLIRDTILFSSQIRVPE